ncbi:MAG: hypothetical protein LBS28_04540 [Streptococcaceae bacterium]|nr:hypothetical protein [Streptococcaceae bacterium]
MFRGRFYLRQYVQKKQSNDIDMSLLNDSVLREGIRLLDYSKAGFPVKENSSFVFFHPLPKSLRF